MKKLVFITLLLLAAGCTVFRSASDVANRAYIGMPVKEFKKLAGKSVELEAMTADYIVYRMNVYNDGRVIGAKFFHFDSSGKLCQLDSTDFRGDFDRWRGTGRY